MNVSIEGAPVMSTNATGTNVHALFIKSSSVFASTGAATNSYSLTVNAMTGATNNYIFDFRDDAGNSRLKLTATGNFTLTQAAQSSSWANAITINPGAHTSMTAGTEFNTVIFTGSTQTWAAGSSTLATQRYNWFKGQTVNAGSGNTITDTENVRIDAPVNGSGTTTNLWALGLNGHTRILDGFNIATGTSTGTTIATSASQKLGHYGATPIVQPANTVAIDTLLVNLGLRASGGVGLFDTDIKAGVVGKGYYVKEGSNATMGTGTLSGGTLVVNTTKVTANSRIFLTDQGGTITNLGSLYISARSVGTSFTVSSTNVLDASDFAWIIFEPA
jgi:hypothetical protein